MGTKTVWLLSGGGARGSIQVPVLQHLRREHGMPDYVAGTSIGAANGFKVAQDDLSGLEKNWLSVDDDSCFNGFDGVSDAWSFALHRRKGLFSLEPFRRKLLQEDCTVDSLKTAFSPGISVRETSSYIQPVFCPGDLEPPLPLVDHVIASCAIAGIFEPVKFNDRTLSDGGHYFPIPVPPREVDRIFVVACTPVISTTIEPTKSVDSVWDAFIWALDQAYHRASMACISELRQMAKKGTNITVYCPPVYPGSMLDMRHSTHEMRFEMGEDMIHSPITL